MLFELLEYPRLFCPYVNTTHSLPLNPLLLFSSTLKLLLFDTDGLLLFWNKNLLLYVAISSKGLWFKLVFWFLLLLIGWSPFIYPMVFEKLICSFYSFAFFFLYLSCGFIVLSYTVFSKGDKNLSFWLLWLSIENPGRFYILFYDYMKLPSWDLFLKSEDKKLVYPIFGDFPFSLYSFGI